MQVLVYWKWSPSHVAFAANCLSCIFAPAVVPETSRCRRRVLRYLSNSMAAAPPPHERAIEPKNILRQLWILKKDCREGGGGGSGLLNLPTPSRFLVASVVQARRAAFATSYHSKNRDRERSAKRLAYYGRGFCCSLYALSLVDN